MEILNFLLENIVWVILAAFVIFIFAAAYYANSAYDKYLQKFDELKKVKSRFRGSAYEFGKLLSEQFFNNQITLQTKPEPELKSHGSYSGNGVITLTPDLMHENNLSAIAVISHEFGHAHQHFFTKMLNKHSSNHRIISLLGNINLLLVIAGCILGFLYGYVYALLCLAFIAFNFLFAIIFKLQTVKIENNASEIAIKMLKNINFDENEITEIKALLKLAKRTYTADFLKAILSWTGLVRRPNFFDF